MTGNRITRRTLVGGLGAGAVLVPFGGQAQGSTPVSDDCIVPQGGEGCLPVAPDSARVDLGTFAFTKPVPVTNPLYPVSSIEQLVQLGTEGDATLRIEVTLLPDTRPVDWEGASVECAVAQYVAYANGSLTEVAFDFFAQADDGSVWYFGEDVSNYEAGELVNTDGTWLAGIDGPAGMIMPAKPEVGRVFRPENVPGFVFEEVTIKETGIAVDAPGGSVSGAVRSEELLIDGTTESKVWAPGYGEFQVDAGDERSAVVLAVPIDTKTVKPVSTDSLVAGLGTLLDTIAAGDTPGNDQVTAITDAWSTVQGGALPATLASELGTAIDALKGSVHDQDLPGTLGIALHAYLIVRDLALLESPVVDVDLLRVDTVAQHLLAAAAIDQPEVASGDIAAIEVIWRRSSDKLNLALQKRVETDIVTMRSALNKGDIQAVTTAATALRDHLAAR